MDRLLGMGHEYLHSHVLRSSPCLSSCFALLLLKFSMVPLNKKPYISNLHRMGPAYYIVGPYYKIYVAIVPIQGEEQ